MKGLGNRSIVLVLLFFGGASTLYAQARQAPPGVFKQLDDCLLYTSPSPRDGLLSRMPSSA